MVHIPRAVWASELLKKANRRIEESDKIHEIVSKKRCDNRKRSKKSNSNKKVGVPNFGQMTLDDSVGQQNCRQTETNDVNWYTVQGWFWKEIMHINPKWAVVEKFGAQEDQTWWTWKEKNCAQRLLKHYGSDVLNRTIKWFVENWQAMKDRSEGKLTGSPTVTLLWVSRERIFADAEAGFPIRPPKKTSSKRKRHMNSEYDEESARKMPGIGWSDGF